MGPELPFPDDEISGKTETLLKKLSVQTVCKRIRFFLR